MSSPSIALKIKSTLLILAYKSLSSLFHPYLFNLISWVGVGGDKDIVSLSGVPTLIVSCEWHHTLLTFLFFTIHYSFSPSTPSLSFTLLRQVLKVPVPKHNVTCQKKKRFHWRISYGQNQNGLPHISIVILFGILFSPFVSITFSLGGIRLQPMGTSIHMVSCHSPHQTPAHCPGSSQHFLTSQSSLPHGALLGLNSQTSTLTLTTCLTVEKQFKVALETKRVIFLVKMKAVNFKPNA